jgi:triacylglycerol lipase
MTISGRTWLFISIGIAVIIVAVALSSFASLVNKPPQASIAAGNPLPVLMIHGLGQDSSVWKKWEDLLNHDKIKYSTLTFQESDDKCGSSFDHAKEIGKKIRGMLSSYNQQYGQVNIVGYDKGGLDARVYLVNGSKDVANLIMIGTPNAGSPLAQRSDVTCKPGVWDLLAGSNATRAKMNPNTKYYTIAGDWQPDKQGDPTIAGPDDGTISVSSVESEGYFQSLGHTNHKHQDLLSEDEYKLSADVLGGRK